MEKYFLSHEVAVICCVLQSGVKKKKRKEVGINAAHHLCRLHVAGEPQLLGWFSGLQSSPSTFAHCRQLLLCLSSPLH